MYPTAAEAAVLESAEKLMKETMARYDPSHDALHVQRVRKTVLRISRHESIAAKNPDHLVIELAALLHDVLDKKYVSAEEAADPYAFFLPFFERQRTENPEVELIDNGRARLIARIVENVSWTTEKKMRSAGLWGEWHDSCVELHCVQDADRLDAIGAFGIMRCAAYSAVTNQSVPSVAGLTPRFDVFESALHVPTDDPSHADSAIQHFHDKLLHIKDRLKTEPGKYMGIKRHNFMLQFLASVEEEYEA